MAFEEGTKEYHLKLQKGDVASTVLLPGDPSRIEKITEFWDTADEVANHREFHTMTGTYNASPLSATSTGIGSPGAAIAVEELARVGAETFIRVGSCGTIQPEIDVGDLVITTGAVRAESTSDDYVRKDYPAVANYEVVSALIAAAERLEYEYHVGMTATTNSFHAGQDRSGFRDFESQQVDDLISEFREANVLNIEMETSAILTLANIFNLRAGAICAVYADRLGDEFRAEGERRAAETASLAANILEKMEHAKTEAGTDHWHAGLQLE